MLLCAAVAQARDVAVIVNRSNPAKNVALADLMKLAKGTTKKWADAREVVLIIKDPASPEMKLVAQRVFGMTPDEVKALVATLNAARRDSVVIVPNDDVAVKTVQTTPGAVGFVDVYSINSSISVLKVDGKSPLEAGYVLHGQ